LTDKKKVGKPNANNPTLLDDIHTNPSKSLKFSPKGTLQMCVLLEQIKRNRENENEMLGVS
jgi:hypothetical protein